LVAEGYAPYLGVGYCREGGLLGEKCFEGLPMGVRGDALTCRGHPYMFISFICFKDVKLISVFVPLTVSYILIEFIVAAIFFCTHELAY
jgi:hypothetical protein